MNEASQPLRDKGIKIYVVGVGSKEDIDEDELIQIAGTQENVLTTDLFEELVVLAEDVTKVICGKKKKHNSYLLCLQATEINKRNDGNEVCLQDLNNSGLFSRSSSLGLHITRENSYRLSLREVSTKRRRSTNVPLYLISVFSFQYSNLIFIIFDRNQDI